MGVLGDCSSIEGAKMKSNTGVIDHSVPGVASMSIGGGLDQECDMESYAGLFIAFIPIPLVWCFLCVIWGFQVIMLHGLEAKAQAFLESPDTPEQNLVLIKVAIVIHVMTVIDKFPSCARFCVPAWRSLRVS